MENRFLFLVPLLIFVLLTPTPLNVAFAHSGRTDGAGCHHVKKTGEYHCHTPKVKKAKQTSKQAARVKFRRSR